MAHESQRIICEKVKNRLPYFFSNKRVLDIGSLDINGNNCYLFTDCDYLGIDIGEGRNVDFVCIAHEYEAPDNYYDTIITTSALEHDMFYEKTITNVIRILKPGGLFLFTCAGIGWPEHGTRRTSIFDAPLLDDKGEWGDYYKNLSEYDIKQINGFNQAFPDGVFENTKEFDLGFFGIKGGNDQLKYIL
ncbi:MAG: methyltransferase domain-containing protein [Lentisphaerota bacterium]